MDHYSVQMAQQGLHYCWLHQIETGRYSGR
jgi:hypothetical protein